MLIICSRTTKTQCRNIPLPNPSECNHSPTPTDQLTTPLQDSSKKRHQVIPHASTLIRKRKDLNVHSSPQLSTSSLSTSRFRQNIAATHIAKPKPRLTSNEERITFKPRDHKSKINMQGPPIRKQNLERRALSLSLALPRSLLL